MGLLHWNPAEVFVTGGRKRERYMDVAVQRDTLFTEDVIGGKVSNRNLSTMLIRKLSKNPQDCRILVLSADHVSRKRHD